MEKIGDTTGGLFGSLLRTDQSRLALVRAAWSEIAGAALADRLEPRELRGQTLVVRAGEASWGAAADAHRAQMLARIRARVPETRISHLVIQGPADLAGARPVAAATRRDAVRRRG